MPSVSIPTDFDDGDDEDKAGDKSPSTPNYVYIDFVGDGNIQNTISQGDELKANTGFGVIYQQYRGTDKFMQSLEVEAVINVASTADTLKARFAQETGPDGQIIRRMINQRDFGSYILNPVSQNQSFSFNANFYFGYPGKETGAKKVEKAFSWATEKFLSGINVRFVSSNNTWQLTNRDSLGVEREENFNLGAFAFRVGPFFEFIPDNKRVESKGSEEEYKSKYSIFFGAYYSRRDLTGDLSFERLRDVRRLFLNSGTTSYTGLELSFGIKINNIRAEFQMPMLNKSKDQMADDQVLGLTRTQFVYSISIIGGFPLRLSEEKQAAAAVTDEK